MSRPLQQLLESAGYTVRSRTQEWSECWLDRGEESWFGRGATPELALDRAVRQAFPSSLSRELLRRALRDEEAAAETSPTLPASPGGGVPLVRPGSAPRRPGFEEALEELRILSERIRDHRGELGLCPPQRQRAAMLAWICEARAKVEAFPGRNEVREEVARISRQLTEIGRLFWPGSVTALQLNMTPEELPSVQLGGSAQSWARAAELAEAQLARQEEAEHSPGFDAHGWCDRAALTALPEHPQELMAELVSSVEQLGGSLAQVASIRGDEQPSPEVYTGWIRTLRALRLWEDGAIDWGRIAGRLRWWNNARRVAPLAGPARELEPSFCPTIPWLDQLGQAGAPMPERPWMNSRLYSSVRSSCRDKRVLIVSDVRDSAQLAAVEEALGCRSLSPQVVEAERVEEAEAQIKAGAYDLVLGAFGFQRAWADRALARASESSSVAYIRSYRGEPWSCMRAVIRAQYASPTDSSGRHPSAG